MNRRRFIQSLAAAFAVPAAPALSLKPVAAALPAAAPSAAASATAMATKARFWTIYMYGLHGSCTPATLSTMLNIPESQAHGYLTKLVADGTIRPNALLRNTVTKVLKGEDNGLVDKVRERIEMKGEDEVEERVVDEKLPEEAMADEGTDAEVDEDLPEEAEGKESPVSVVEAVEGEEEQVGEESETASQSPQMSD